MFMTNIPRRKIYETMLIYEDAMIDMQILLLSEENFEKFIKKFNKKSIPQLKSSFKEVKALLLMFLENRKYPLGKDFESDLKLILKDEKKCDRELLNNKNFPEKFKYVMEETNKTLEELKEIRNYKEAISIFETLDAFNSHVPKILEIRRDEIR